MHLITRKFSFDAGHRVLGHEGKCQNLHGHTYTAELTVTPAAATGLDALGRVIDFSVLKEKVGSWIDLYWDHNFIAHPEDPLLACHGNPGLLSHRSKQPISAVVGDGKDPYVMPAGTNPTAENLAALLYEVAADLLRPDGIKVVEVTVHETPNCRATYRPTQILVPYDEARKALLSEPSLPSNHL